MNRAFVFKPGRHAWWVELAMFMAVSGFAMILATVLSGFLISRFGLMTTLAVLIEVLVSFVFNFLIRKFIIFKG
jgi:putative flippase GtrA